MPDWRQYVRTQLPPLDISPEREMEIVDELALQLEAAYDGALSRGASEDDALDKAYAEVPDWPALAHTLVAIERPVAARAPRVIRPTSDQPAIGAGTGGIMLGFTQDVRYALRSLMRAPAFAVAAILTLALGIGATTIVFSLVDGILLRPLPIGQPERVVLAREINPQGVEFSLAWPNFVDWQARAKSFADLAAWRGLPANLTGLAEPQRIMTRQVTWNLFNVLGVQPVVGRNFTAADDVPGVPRVGLVSYGFWQRHFGGDPAAIGKQILLDETPVTIVGVLPRSFTVARVEDAFLPFGNFLTPNNSSLHRGNHNGLAAIGRLAPGVSLEAARAELAVIAQQLEAEYPDTNSGNGAAANLLYEVLVRQSRPALVVLIGAVVAMLLIACVNIANLLLVRGTARAQELEVRRALGAERWRLLRQLLTESVLLALVGGAAGVALAYGGFGLFVALLPADQARVHMVEINGRVLMFAAAASILAGLLFGLVPALQAGSSRAMALLRSARVAGAGGGRGKTRQLLLVAELSLALVLLVAAGLMVRTMQNLFAIDLGFESEPLLSAQVSLPGARYNADQRRVFYGRVEERIAAIPGVTGVAFTLSLPVQNSNWGSVFIVEGQPVPARADLPAAAMIPISPSYPQTIGLRLLRGRAFTRTDVDGSPRVAIVNETFARRFWPDGDAIGKRFKQGWPESPTPWREIVGVVNDVKIGGIDITPGLQAYFPLAQEPSSALAVVARAAGDPARLRAAVEAAIHEIDPNLPIYDVRTLGEIVNLAVGQQRLLMVLLLGFGVLAMVLAAVGVFGVNAYAVSQRTHELGVRMALGADRGKVMRLVLGQGLVTCVIGIAIGLAAALAMAQLLTKLLYQIEPRDPATLVTVTTVLLLVTAAACYLPARRATRIDPVAALRAD